MTTLLCPPCNQPHPADARFCPETGQPLPEEVRERVIAAGRAYVCLVEAVDILLER